MQKEASCPYDFLLCNSIKLHQVQSLLLMLPELLLKMNDGGLLCFSKLLEGGANLLFLNSL